MNVIVMASVASNADIDGKHAAIDGEMSRARRLPLSAELKVRLPEMEFAEPPEAVDVGVLNERIESGRSAIREIRDNGRADLVAERYRWNSRRRPARTERSIGRSS